MLFNNTDSNNPIRGVPEYVESVAYHSGPKGLVVTFVMPQYTSESLAIQSIRRNLRSVLYVDNCSVKLLLRNLWKTPKLLTQKLYISVVMKDND